MRRRPLLGVVLLAAGLSGCAGYDEVLGPRAEPPAQGDGYLERGPGARVDLGDGGEQLLTRFQKLLEENETLQERNRELANEVDTVREALQRESEAAAEERRLRAGVEAENERLRAVKNERELEVLHLQLRLAELERRNLQLEITEMERELAALDREAGSPAAEPQR